MRSLLLSFLILIAVAPAPAQDIDYARQVVDTLTTPYFFGRGYVKDGHKKAANYIASQFARFGVEPFGNDYFQEFMFQVNTFPGAMEMTADGKLLQAGIDYIVHPCSPAYEGSFEVEDVKIKKLTKEGKFGAIALDNDLENDFLLFDRTKLKIDKPDKVENYTTALQVMQRLEQPIPLGVVELREDKLTWFMSQHECRRPLIMVKKDAVDGDIEKFTIKYDQKLETALPTQNVIGYIPGTVEPDSFLVFSAHYDHLGGMGDSVYFPGANDDASGVSMMLTLAKYFSQNPPKYSVAFMAFSAEEVGLIGSQFYVSRPLFPLSRIKFLINMDMVGTGDEGITVVNATEFPEAFGLLQKINEEEQYLKTVNSRGKAANSDHHFFTEEGVPAFFIYTQGGVGWYHDPLDRAETLPLTEFEDLFRLIVKFTEQY